MKDCCPSKHGLRTARFITISHRNIRHKRAISWLLGRAECKPLSFALSRGEALQPLFSAWPGSSSQQLCWCWFLPRVLQWGVGLKPFGWGFVPISSCSEVCTKSFYRATETLVLLQHIFLLNSPLSPPSHTCIFAYVVNFVLTSAYLLIDKTTGTMWHKLFSKRWMKMVNHTQGDIRWLSREQRNMV